jgi:hypothetical protein
MDNHLWKLLDVKFVITIFMKIGWIYIFLNETLANSIKWKKIQKFKSIF